MNRQEALLAIQAAEDAMLVYGPTEETEAGLAAAMSAWCEVAIEDSLQATLARTLGEALEREGAHFPAGQTFGERFAALVEAAGFGPVPERVEVTYTPAPERQIDEEA